MTICLCSDLKGGSDVASVGKKERNLFFIFKQTVVDIYHHLGYSMFISVLWFGLLVVSILFAQPFFNLLPATLENQTHPLNLFLSFLMFGVPYAAFILGPVQTVLFYQMNQVINDEAELKGLWDGLRKHYWTAAGVYALYTGLLLFCLVDLVICFFVLKDFTLKILGFFLLYLFLFLVFATLYLPGLLVLQRNTVKKVIKKTLILFLDNTLLTVGAFFILVLVGVVFTLIAPLLLLFFGSFLQVFMIHLFHGVMAKYPDLVVPALEESAGGSFDRNNG